MSTPEPRRTAVIVNPSKLDGDGSPFRDAVREALAAGGRAAPTFLETSVEDPGFGMAREALADGVDLVLVHGGDGTVNAVVSVLAGHEVPLGLLPGGTGNLLARNVGVPRELAAALDVALAGHTRRLDVGVFDDDDTRAFAVMTGIGFDAVVVAEAPTKLKKVLGWPAYLVSAARHLNDRSMSVVLTIDEAPPVRLRARSVLVGNVGTLQGGIPLLPDAQPDDGQLDVAVMSPHGLLDWVRVALTVVLRRTRPHRTLTWYRGASIRVDTAQPHPREIDGDAIDPGTSIAVTVKPSSLVLVVPEGAETVPAAG